MSTPGVFMQIDYAHCFQFHQIPRPKIDVTQGRQLRIQCIRHLHHFQRAQPE